ncbi:MAG: hypothetical protein C5B57_05665 [Blastocatellia bacterium]|nr:MAG: hypothetical protein C5B57_05665 [Blastocatellia bacterium]
MTQRWIEIVIGRLVTDENLRRKFSSNARQTLMELVESGTHLTQAEIAALLAIDTTLWDEAAQHIDLTGIRANQK